MAEVDRWAEIWSRQTDQQNFFDLDPSAMRDQDKEKLCKDLLLGLHEEVQELSKYVTHYRVHDLKKQPFNKGNIIAEVTDIFKYTLAIAITHGVTAEEIFEEFLEKTQVLDKRIEGERIELKSTTKIIVSDLDGCICSLENWWDLTGDTPEAKDQFVNERKDRFYQSGKFRELDPVPGAREVLQKLVSEGYKIVILTSRPHWQYKRVYGDTVFWLDKHKIPYDILLFAEDKPKAIFKHLHPAKPEWVIEDRDNYAIELVNNDHRVLLLDYDYNRSASHERIRRVQNWQHISQILGL